MAVPYLYEDSALSGSQFNDDMNYFEDNKVDKEDGKSLSTNDLTDELKDKLDNIEDNANNYTHPSSHSISDIDGLSDALDGKQPTITTLELSKIENSDNIVFLINGKIPALDGSQLVGVAKPKKEMIINSDTTLDSTHLNNIIVVKNTGTLTTLTLPLSSSVVGSEILIVNETDNHTKVLSQSNDKINTFNYYALMEIGANIRLTATSKRWVASIVGNVYNDVYMSV